MTDNAGFHCSLPLRFFDFAGGHLNYVRFVELAQEARLAWVRDRIRIPGSRVPVAMVRWMETDYRASIDQGVTDSVHAEVEVLSTGRSSFTLRVSMRPSPDDEPCVVVDTVLVVTGPDGSPQHLDEAERAALQAEVRSQTPVEEYV